MISDDCVMILDDCICNECKNYEGNEGGCCPDRRLMGDECEFYVDRNQEEEIMSKKDRIKKLKEEKKKEKWKQEQIRRVFIFKGRIVAKITSNKYDYIKEHNKVPSYVKIPENMRNFFGEKILDIPISIWDIEKDNEYIKKEKINVNTDIAVI